MVTVLVRSTSFVCNMYFFKGSVESEPEHSSFLKHKVFDDLIGRV